MRRSVQCMHRPAGRGAGAEDDGSFVPDGAVRPAAGVVAASLSPPPGPAGRFILSWVRGPCSMRLSTYGQRDRGPTTSRCCWLARVVAVDRELRVWALLPRVFLSGARSLSACGVETRVEISESFADRLSECWCSDCMRSSSPPRTSVDRRVVRYSQYAYLARDSVRFPDRL